MTKALVVAHVAVGSSNVSDETLIVFSADTSCESSLLKFMEIFFLEESLEDQEKWWRLVAQLMQDHLGTSPRGFRQEVSVVLLLVRKMRHASPHSRFYTGAVTGICLLLMMV